MVNIKATPRFMRLARKSITAEALQELIDTLAKDPEKGVIIKGTGGIRKIRWKTGKGDGKRGGIRVLYYYAKENLIILLVSLFKKADKENIDSGEKEELRKLIMQLLE